MKKSLTLTVTQLMHYGVCPYRAKLLYRLGAPTPSGGEREEKTERTAALSAQDLGTIVHRLLELADFARLEPSAEEHLKKQFPSLPRQAATAALKLVAQWGKSELCQQARRAAHLYKERSFLLSLDGGTLEGAIDLVFAAAGDTSPLQIVDYKTSAEHAEYRFQLELYQWAAQRLWENRPVSGGLFYLEEGKFVPVSYPGAAAVEKKATQLAADWRTERFDPRPSKEACGRCTVRAICSFRAV